MTAITDQTKPTSATFTPRIGMEARRQSGQGLREEGRPQDLVGGRARLQVERPGPARSLANLFDYGIELGEVWIAGADHVARWWRSARGVMTGPGG